METTVQTLPEFEAEAARFATELAPREQGAILVTLSGGLGVGKTAFTKAVARTFGVVDVVTSPTFVLEKVYPLTNQRFKKLIHIDAYRLETGADLAPLDFDALMADPGNLIFLEWPERVIDALPEPTRKISFVAHANTSRTISYV
jgi:tRNA threonylcarbamoyladenosine biosynthesis protein TsaE